MNELQVFNNSEFGEIRMVMVENEPYFVGKDITNILGYSNSSKALQDHVDDEDKLNNDSLSSLGQRGGWIINESGLYSLILSSKLPNAKKFKKWVTSEVLPSIRKHGAYMNDETLEKALTNPDFLIQLATQLKNEKAAKEILIVENKIKDQQIAELQPKADYTDKILKSKSLVTITQIAKDYGMSGREMNSILHKLGIQYKQSKQWLLYARYQGKGYTHSETMDIERDDGTTKVVMNTKWTQKGRLFLYDLLKQEGILPVIEQ